MRKILLNTAVIRLTKWFVVGLVAGTTVNYFLDDGLNRASILFPGVLCFLVAVVLGSFCHASNVADIQAKLKAAEASAQTWAFLSHLPTAAWFFTLDVSNLLNCSHCRACYNLFRLRLEDNGSSFKNSEASAPLLINHPSNLETREWIFGTSSALVCVSIHPLSGVVFTSYLDHLHYHKMMSVWVSKQV